MFSENHRFADSLNKHVIRRRFNGSHVARPSVTSGYFVSEPETAHAPVVGPSRAGSAEEGPADDSDVDGY